MGSPSPIFVRDEQGYERDLDILGNAQEHAATYLQLHTGKPYDECLFWVQQQTNPLVATSKPIKVLKRQDNGDRVRAMVRSHDWFKEILTESSILTPNMVVYRDSLKEVSCTAAFITDKMTKRGIIKKEGFAAWQNKNWAVSSRCANQEYKIKVGINSISGAHSSPHNSLYNKTAHSSLTSNCRVIVTYSNASSERFLSGNRHYWSKDVVIENLLSFVRFTDFDALQSVVNRYNLHLPSVDEVMKMIKRSTDFYWRNDHWDITIRATVERLSPLQRAAAMYTGDLYHLAEYNPELVRKFFDLCIDRVDSDGIVDPEQIVKKASGNMLVLGSYLCSDIIKGKKLVEVQEQNPAGYLQLAATLDHVPKVLKDFEDLIKTLWVNDNAPSSIYVFPTSIRRNVVGSDTDSTMFSVQDWIEWYFGKITFQKRAKDLSNLLCYLNNEVIGHLLAMCSKQMGVADHNLYKLEMKNEYSFLVYMRTNIAKHYVAAIVAREGNVFDHIEIEIKGVALKDSKVPKQLMQWLKEEFEETVNAILEERGIDAYPLFQRIANLEHMLDTSLLNGEIKVLSSINISSEESYKKPMQSGYMHYDLWLNVFEQQFGEIAAPPYRAVKVSVDLNTQRQLDQWVASLDPVIGDPLRVWVLKNKRKKFKNLLLPYELFEGGLPDEFARIVDRRGIISQMMRGYYMLLETCGFYIKGKENTILLSDEIPFRPEHGYPGKREEKALA